MKQQKYFFILYYLIPNRNMIRGISSSPIQLNEKHRFPEISNFAYLQVQDSDSSRSSSSSLPDHTEAEHYQHQSRFKRRAKREHGSLSKALSDNITMILEDLLKDYDKTERPGYITGNLSILVRKCIFYFCF